VTHGRGFKTVYAHLGSVRTTRGRTVARGEVIGTVGMSGLTTGPHLHYEIWLRDKQLNPEEYIFPDDVAMR
jgi:murein DD-endopeptidase MepM/ murein hydrolase activator NlpD